MLTLEEANRVIAAALNYAREHGYRVSVGVCDTFGYPIAHQRMDGALPLTPHYSIAKAVTSHAHVRYPKEVIQEALLTIVATIRFRPEQVPTT